MSKTQKILGHLREGKSITPLAALKQYGSLRLAAEIHRIREWGWKVVSEPVRRGKSIVACYRLAE